MSNTTTKTPAYRTPDENTKMRMSAAKSSVLNPMYNKNHSEETKELISKKLKDAWSRRPNRPFT
ncbi:MAG: hypothetical protein LBI15_00125 [Dysgonamonadaceae bacterium]|jgi:hypothetical protein|nr:hypothetical protein [Dysgonamonadaceae bacterium]